MLSDSQMRTALAYIKEYTRYPLKYRVIFLLSCKGGLRAKAIAGLRWGMVTDPEGNLADGMTLPKEIVKGGKKTRYVPFNALLKEALEEMLTTIRTYDPDAFVIKSERGQGMSSVTIRNWFYRLYKNLGFDGCSSHSGRRTFTTKAARSITSAGGSLRDVMELVGHNSIQTTQRYIEGDSEAQRKVVDLI